MLTKDSESKREVIAIVACDEGHLIGQNNQIPWHLPEDLKHFSQLTSGHNVLMGSKTYFSLPTKFRPLPNRKNFVISRNPASLKSESGITIVTDPVDFIKKFKDGIGEYESQQLWIIGGAQIYELTSSLWDRLELTLVSGKHSGDAYIPSFEQDFKLVAQEDFTKFSFKSYVKH